MCVCVLPLDHFFSYILNFCLRRCPMRQGCGLLWTWWSSHTTYASMRSLQMPSNGGTNTQRTRNQSDLWLFMDNSVCVVVMVYNICDNGLDCYLWQWFGLLFVIWSVIWTVICDLDCYLWFRDNGLVWNLVTMVCFWKVEIWYVICGFELWFVICDYGHLIGMKCSCYGDVFACKCSHLPESPIVGAGAVQGYITKR